MKEISQKLVVDVQLTYDTRGSNEAIDRAWDALIKYIEDLETTIESWAGLVAVHQGPPMTDEERDEYLRNSTWTMYDKDGKIQVVSGFEWGKKEQ